ncbi:MAG: FHA domain-containing protein [Chloroflexi bacterium]|nr:FHA domain-containing protein [Chloroflexota bacterium]
MKTCPYCAHLNREGELFCVECGHPFIGQQGVATTQLTGDDRAVYERRMAWGTARFDPQSTILVHVQNHAEPINLASKDELMLGRSDLQTGWAPDLDMSPFGGAEMGVSRRHASIRRGENTLMLVDLGSANGTHLNGQRLTPDQPRVLRDGDEVRMGKLVFRIYFKTVST